MVLGLLLTSFSISSCTHEEKINYLDYLDYTTNVDNTITITGIKDKGLKKMVIPSTIDDLLVTNIGSFAFENCFNLTEVGLPSWLTSISKKAFTNCRSLIKINIPEKLEIIEKSVFDNCSSIYSIVVPKNITEIKDGSFSNCYRLCEVYNLSSLYIVPGAFTNGSISLHAHVVHTSPDEDTIIYSIDEFVFANYRNCDILIDYTGNSEKVDVNFSTTRIGYKAFYKKSIITEINIGPYIACIDAYAFAGLINLSAINYPNTMYNWKSIDKGVGWDDNTGNYLIFCRDGIIIKE